VVVIALRVALRQQLRRAERPQIDLQLAPHLFRRRHGLRELVLSQEIQPPGAAEPVAAARLGPCQPHVEPPAVAVVGRHLDPLFSVHGGRGS
jgi:hypothetical protein